MKTNILTLTLGLAIHLGFASSPPVKKIATGKINNVSITISYEPLICGVDHPGNLNGSAGIWSPSHSGLAVIEFDSPTGLNGKKIPKGKYSLFLTCQGSKWQIILNKKLSAGYEEESDFMRLEFVSSQTDYKEKESEFQIDDLENFLIFKWQNVVLMIPVTNC